MKKFFIAICGLSLTWAVGAQNAYDVERMMGNELNGTARFVGMGGAMSALGGDISVMSSNPAGIGIFRSNDASVSFGFNNTEAKSDFHGNSMKESKTRASLDQLGFVYTYKVGNNTSLRFVNFGFNYHKGKNFNRLFAMGGQLDGLSQSWQLASEMDYAGVTSTSAFDAILDSKDPYRDYWNRYPVLGVMAVNTGVVDWPNYAEYLLGWDGARNHFFSQEKGGIHQYDFNIAFNIEDRLYIGATLGLYDVLYDRYSSYTEDLNGYMAADGSDGNIYALPAENDQVVENGGYTLENYYRLEGSGADLKLGVIVRPFEESPFRLGLSVHTPTWFELTESYNATLSSDILAYESPYSQTLSDHLSSDYLTYDYKMITPWKFNVSAGTTFGGVLALGAEYEYSDYTSTKLEDVDGFELGGQASVEDALEAVHTFRAGMEARIASQFSFRAGYNYTSAAFKDDAYSALDVYRTHTDFNNVKSKNTVTFGLGYRGNTIYADMAYKCDMYKSDFYAFDDVDLPKTVVDNARHQLVFTLGARF